MATACPQIALGATLKMATHALSWFRFRFLGPPGGQHALSTLGAAMADNPVLELLLRRLEAADGGLDSAELATQLGVEHQVVVGAVKSLQALGEVSSARAAGPPRFYICAPL